MRKVYRWAASCLLGLAQACGVVAGPSVQTKAASEALERQAERWAQAVLTNVNDQLESNGYALVRHASETGRSVEDSATFLSALTRRLGPVMRAGLKFEAPLGYSLIQTDVTTLDKSGNPSERALAADLPHTEGAHISGHLHYECLDEDGEVTTIAVPLAPPRHVLLACPTPAPQGGASLALDLQALRATVHERAPDLYAQLTRPIWQHRAPDGRLYPPQPEAVFPLRGNGEEPDGISDMVPNLARFRHNSLTVADPDLLSANSAAGIREAFVDILSDFVEGHANTPNPIGFFTHRLAPGEVMIWDNARTAHGRLAITQLPRTCLRMWTLDERGAPPLKLHGNRTRTGVDANRTNNLYGPVHPDSFFERWFDGLSQCEPQLADEAALGVTPPGSQPGTAPEAT